MTVPILVTGAFGQVGRRCVANLLARGHTVVASDLRTEAALSVVRTLADQHTPGTLLPAYADLLDPAAIGSLVARHQPRAIVHLAAMLSPVSYRNPELARRINVGGTRTLVRAAQGLAAPPLFVYASSAGVYGSRNPYRHPERLSAQTAVDPVDQYGEDKMLAERIIVNSGLSHAILRRGGVISPDGAGALNRDYLLLMRATPGDNRLHTVDARDAALAFANAAERPDSVDGKILLIGGDDSHLNLHRDVEDDILQAIGLGRLGPQASLPGDPDDDRGWSFTGWLDTTESQALLDYQHHSWAHTVDWVASAQPRAVRVIAGALGPLARPVVRTALTLQRRAEHRGPYADPWTLISAKLGSGVLASNVDPAPT